MDYLTNDTELTDVADAIREKCETTDLLEWPDGFIQAIEDCQTGGPELEWLWGNQITDTMSGTIDSTDDAYAAPILNLGVDGVSEQVTYSGKNLFDKSTAIASTYINSNGVTASGSSNSCTNFIQVVGGESYAFSYGAALSAGNYIAWYTDADQATVTGNRVDARGLTSIVATAPNDANYVRFSFQTSALNGVQLEKASAATAYEPYTGGKPSPNPDYPQAIESVVDPVVAFAGKNLFDIATARFNTNAVYPVVKTETGITVTAGAETGWAYAVTSVDIFDEQTVTLSTTPSTTTPLILASGYDANNAITVSKQVLANTVTVSLPSGTVRLTLYFYARQTASGAVGDTCTYNDIQLELGSTATAYEPYQGQSVSLYDGTLRSLPDGTKDELHLTYLKPSKDHEGWAWYEREVTSYVGLTVLDGTLPISIVNWRGSETSVGFGYSRANFPTADAWHIMSDKLQMVTYGTLYNKEVDNGIALAEVSQSGIYSVFLRLAHPELTTGALVNAWLAENPITVQYPLATPVTTTLDPIELPIMPSENATVWCDGGSAQPTFMLEYIQNANIVISRLEDTIADLATS